MKATNENISRLMRLKNKKLLHIIADPDVPNWRKKDVSIRVLIGWKIEDVEVGGWFKKKIERHITELYFKNSTNINTEYMSVYSTSLDNLVNSAEMDSEQWEQLNFELEQFNKEKTNKKSLA